MPVVLNSSNVVVIGRFNPYIFSPQWLYDQGVLPNQNIRLALGAVQDGVNFRTDEGINWHVDDRLLRIDAPNCGALAAQVLRLLPHTPISAIGVNFSFRGDNWQENNLPMLGNRGLGDLPNAQLLKLTGVFHFDKTRVGMEIANGSLGVTIDLNHHFDVSETEKAAEFASDFEAIKSDSARLIRDVLGEDFDDWN